jgi:anti-sigma factor RsiW
MRCSEFAEILWRVEEGPLPPGRVLELERHAAASPRCRAERALRESMGRALGEPGPGGPSPDFTARVLRRIGAGRKPQRRAQAVRALVPAASFAAVAALLLVVGAGIGRLAGPAGWSSPWPAFLGRLAGALSGTLRALMDPFERVLEGASSAAPVSGTTLSLTAVVLLAVAWGLREVLDYLRE